MEGRGYQPEFRRRVLDLVDAGRKIAEVAGQPRDQRSDDLHTATQDRID